MKLCITLPFALAAALALAGSASAQKYSIYGAAGLTDYAYNYNYAGSNNLASKGDTIGLLGGSFYTFPINSRLKPAIDARFSFSPGNRGGETGAVAFRLAFVPHKNPLRPFFELGGGVVSTTTHGYTSSERSTGGALMLDFGLDIRLNEHFDLRVPEYGALAGSKSGTAFLNIGVVYHFD